MAKSQGNYFIFIFSWETQKHLSHSIFERSRIFGTCWPSNVEKYIKEETQRIGTVEQKISEMVIIIFLKKLKIIPINESFYLQLQKKMWKNMN